MEPKAVMRVAWVASASLAIGSGAGAGPLVDLGAAVAPRPEVGDYRVYADEEGSLRVEVDAVTDLPSGWSARERIVCAAEGALVVEESAGADEGTAVDLLENPGTTGCPAFLSTLVDSYRSFPLAMRMGAKLRFEYTDLSRLFIGISSDVRGHRRLARAGRLETPYASHDTALRILSHAHIEDGFLAPPGWDGRFTAQRRTSWFVDGIGLVGETSRSRSYHFGRLEEIRRSEFWLREGVIGGVPYPPD